MKNDESLPKYSTPLPKKRFQKLSLKKNSSSCPPKASRPPAEGGREPDDAGASSHRGVMLSPIKNQEIICPSPTFITMTRPRCIFGKRMSLLQQQSDSDENCSLELKIIHNRSKSLNDLNEDIRIQEETQLSYRIHAESEIEFTYHNSSLISDNKFKNDSQNSEEIGKESGKYVSRQTNVKSDENSCIELNNDESDDNVLNNSTDLKNYSIVDEINDFKEIVVKSQYFTEDISKNKASNVTNDLKSLQVAAEKVEVDEVVVINDESHCSDANSQKQSDQRSPRGDVELSPRRDAIMDDLYGEVWRKTPGLLNKAKSRVTRVDIAGNELDYEQICGKLDSLSLYVKSLTDVKKAKQTRLDDFFKTSNIKDSQLLKPRSLELDFENEDHGSRDFSISKKPTKTADVLKGCDSDKNKPNDKKSREMKTASKKILYKKNATFLNENTRDSMMPFTHFTNLKSDSNFLKNSSKVNVKNSVNPQNFPQRALSDSDLKDYSKLTHKPIKDSGVFNYDFVNDALETVNKDFGSKIYEMIFNKENTPLSSNKPKFVCSSDKKHSESKDVRKPLNKKGGKLMCPDIFDSKFKKKISDMNTESKHEKINKKLDFDSANLIDNLNSNEGKSGRSNVKKNKSNSSTKDKSKDLNADNEMLTKKKDNHESSDSEDCNLAGPSKPVKKKCFLSSSGESSNEAVKDAGVDKGCEEKDMKALTKSLKNVNLNKESNNDWSYGFMASLSDKIPSWRCDPIAAIFKKDFRNRKEELTKKLFKMFNENVFEAKFDEDLPIVWNIYLTTTAGRALNKIKRDRHGVTSRLCTIELSSKVVDTAVRLRNTLAHELCHAAAWIIDGQLKDGHGRTWKAWVARTLSAYPELKHIPVCHSLEIHCKFTFKCVDCGYSINRHSKSIDVDKVVCGYCHGKFQCIRNKKTRSGLIVSTPVKDKARKPATGFARYVQENYGNVRSEHTPHKETMQYLGKQYAKLKDKHT